MMSRSPMQQLDHDRCMTLPFEGACNGRQKINTPVSMAMSMSVSMSASTFTATNGRFSADTDDTGSVVLDDLGSHYDLTNLRQQGSRHKRQNSEPLPRCNIASRPGIPMHWPAPDRFDRGVRNTVHPLHQQRTRYAVDVVGVSRHQFIHNNISSCDNRSICSSQDHWGDRSSGCGYDHDHQYHHHQEGHRRHHSMNHGNGHHQSHHQNYDRHPHNHHQHPLQRPHQMMRPPHQQQQQHDFNYSQTHDFRQDQMRDTRRNQHPTGARGHRRNYSLPQVSSTYSYDRRESFAGTRGDSGSLRSLRGNEESIFPTKEDIRSTIPEVDVDCLMSTIPKRSLRQAQSSHELHYLNRYGGGMQTSPMPSFGRQPMRHLPPMHQVHSNQSFQRPSTMNSVSGMKNASWHMTNASVAPTLLSSSSSASLQSSHTGSYSHSHSHSHSSQEGHVRPKMSLQDVAIPHRVQQERQFNALPVRLPAPMAPRKRVPPSYHDEKACCDQDDDLGDQDDERLFLSPDQPPSPHRPPYSYAPHSYKAKAPPKAPPKVPPKAPPKAPPQPLQSQPQSTTTTTTKRYATPNKVMVQVAPGEFLHLRGAQETWECIKRGLSCTVSCLECSSTLQCVPDCQVVLCPSCKMLTPLSAAAVASSNDQAKKATPTGEDFKPHARQQLPTAEPGFTFHAPAGGVGLGHIVDSQPAS